MKKANTTTIIIVALVIIALILLFLFIRRGQAPPTINEFLGKEVSFQSSDGTQVKGYLSRPKGNNLPAIILIHGGESSEKAAENLGKGKHAQTLKQNGYVTLSIDYRKSEYGGKEIDDVIAGLNYLQSLDYVNSNKIGIFGGSHGAYITLQTSTKVGNQVKAIVENFGPADLIGMYNDVLVNQITCDDAEKKQRLREMADNYFGGSPENNDPLWKERSPIYHIDKIQAPILIIHGKQDCVVPVKYAYQLKNELEKQNKPYEIKIFDNGPHSFIYKNTQEAKEAGQITLDFFNKYLK